MKSIFLAMVVAAGILSACVVGTDRRGRGVVVVSPLPSIVVLEEEPYYFHGGYHYHYRDNAWFYSHSRGGPWIDLPRSHYPKELRFKGKDKGDRRDDDRRRGDDRDDRR